MYKNKKYLNLLAGLDEEVTVHDVYESRLKNGDICIYIRVDHKIHNRPCVECGSKLIKKYGSRTFRASHIPQGKRKVSQKMTLPE